MWALPTLGFRVCSAQWMGTVANSANFGTKNESFPCGVVPLRVSMALKLLPCYFLWEDARECPDARKLLNPVLSQKPKTFWLYLLPI